MITNVTANSVDVIPGRSALLHPLCIFLFVWLGVWVLYTLHLSDLLIFSDSAVRDAIVEILIPFLGTCLAVLAILKLLSKSFPQQSAKDHSWNLERLDHRVSVLFAVWCGVSLLEIAVSGGVPLLWAIRGTTKTYFDFGIPSIHGFLNSLIQTLAIVRIAISVKTGKVRYLLLPAFVLAWSIIVLTRNMMIVVLVEGAVIWLSFNRLRFMNFIRLAAAVVVLILAFGVIGDTRNSNLDIRAVGQATHNYPEWLPSGVLWAYLYVTTPINNLVNTIESKVPTNDVLFSSTTSALFPTVVRPLIYGTAKNESFEGDLVNESFNVSTAYMTPFQDYGHPGMLLYGVVIAAVCSFYWRKRSLCDTLIYSVLAQCLVLSIFFNHFFFLPIICQVFWIRALFSRRTLRLFPAKSLLISRGV